MDAPGWPEEKRTDDYRAMPGRGTVQEMGRDERDTEYGGYDDWFDEPEPPPERRRRGGRRSPDTASTEETWVFPATSERAAREPREPLVILGHTVTTTQAAIIAVSGLVILLAILAAAGVFSSGSTPVATPPTVATTTPPAATPTVTTPTTPAKPAVTAPTSTLKPGDTGAQVKLLQKALKSLGYSPGGIDGSYGPGTKQAVATFQNSKELTADGVFGPATLAALQQALSTASTGGATTKGGTGTASVQPPSTTLKPGDKGTQVKLLQQALKALGYTIGTIDGQYGPGTKAAVQAFQNAQGLSADGLVGPKTLAALQQVLSTATG